MKIFFVLALLASSIAISSSLAKNENTLHIYRKPHRYLSEPEQRQATRNGGRFVAGRMIPLNGNLFQLGAYFVNVYVGSQGPFNVIIDTGSANFAIPTSGCQTCNSKIYYDPSSSKTFSQMSCESEACHRCTPLPMAKPSNSSSSGYSRKNQRSVDLVVSNDKSDEFPSARPSSCVFGPTRCYHKAGQCGMGITYGGGSSEFGGSYGTDIVSIGGLSAPATVGLIYEEYPSGSFGDGILGLNYPFNACNPTCVAPLIDSFVQSGALQNNLFGMCLTQNNGGALDFGFFDSAKYSGALQWVPVSFQRWYNFDIVSIVVGSTSIGLPQYTYATTNDVIGSFVDSGTSIILTGPLIFSAIQNVFQTQYSSLPGVMNGFFGNSSCISAATMGNHLSQFPAIHFIAAGEDSTLVDLAVPPSDYLMFYEGQYCLGIAPTASLGVILGDVFLQSYYVAYDRYNARLGFAPVNQANCKGN